MTILDYFLLLYDEVNKLVKHFNHENEEIRKIHNLLIGIEYTRYQGCTTDDWLKKAIVTLQHIRARLLFLMEEKLYRE